MTISASTVSEAYPPERQLSVRAVERLSGLLAGLDRLEPILQLPEYPLTSPVGIEFSHFRLKSRLGAGRFGVVLLADDCLLCRQVVVKVPQPTVLADMELRRRFSREALATARLDHSGIVSALEAGEVDGLPYLAAAFIRGPSLRQWRLDHPNPVESRTAASLVSAVAHAVHHAHERGILHCDLTPSNILLELDGPASDLNPLDDLSAAKPLVTDFGLARIVDDDPALTMTFQVAGTPLYMSPEQARGERGLTPMTDIYALGVLLYDLLVGHPPFHEETSQSILTQVQTSVPVPPKQIVPAVSSDLNAVCLKCLEKNPADRYSSAKELANDLDCFLAGEPVTARSISAATRLARWAVRNPMSAGISILGLLLVVATIGVATDRWVKEVRTRLAWKAEMVERVAASTRAEALEAQVSAAEFYATLERVRQRRHSRVDGWATANREDLRRMAAQSIREEAASLRTEAAAVVSAIDLGLPRTIAAGFHAHCVAYDPTGSTLAVAGYSTGSEGVGVVRLMDVAAGALTRELQFAADRGWEGRSDGRLDGCWSVAISPQADRLAVGTRSGGLLIWDLNQSNPNPIASWRHSPASGTPETAKYERVTGLIFDGTGRLWSGDEQTAACWDPTRNWAESDRRTGHLGHSNNGRCGTEVVVRDARHAVHPSLDLQVRREDQELIIADWENRPVGRLAMPDDQRADESVITSLVVSPDGNVVAATAAHAGHLKLWDLAGSRLLASRNMAEGTLDMAFRPDGQQLAVVQTDGVQLFEVIQPTVTDVVGMGAFPLDDADLTSDGNFLATIATIPSPWNIVLLNAYDLTLPSASQMRARITQAPPSGNSRKRVALSADGQQVVTHALDVLARFQMPNITPERFGQPRDTRDLRFSSAGQLWAAGADMVVTWPDGVHEVSIPRSGVRSFVIHGECALVGYDDGLITCHSASGELIRSHHPTTEPIMGLAQEGDLVIAGTASGDLLMMRGDQSPQTISRAHDDAIWAVSIGPRGWFATGASDRLVKVRDDRGQPVLTLPQTRPVRRLFWSADGHTLSVLAEGERGIRRWRLDRLRSEIADLGIDCSLPEDHENDKTSSQTTGR